MHPAQPDPWLCLFCLKGHFGLAIKQMHTLLVELEPDLLVGRDGDAWQDAYVDDGAREQCLNEGHVASRLDRVGPSRDRAWNRALVQLDCRVARSEHNFPGCR